MPLTTTHNENGRAPQKSATVGICVQLQKDNDNANLRAYAADFKPRA